MTSPDRARRLFVNYAFEQTLVEFGIFVLVGGFAVGDGGTWVLIDGIQETPC